MVYFREKDRVLYLIMVKSNKHLTGTREGVLSVVMFFLYLYMIKNVRDDHVRINVAQETEIPDFFRQ
ncbi:MAG: hypothetical protein EA394_07875 [Bacteroidia bacterium]|nr:MAG: hypothetical protein EA394_07875 [Bacteroidia bacterium]